MTKGLQRNLNGKKKIESRDIKKLINIESKRRKALRTVMMNRWTQNQTMYTRIRVLE
jgi:hypothetical protein